MQEKFFLFIRTWYAHGLLSAVICLHALFLYADPALSFDFSRGPFTDEGFYLAQLRNYINGHGWGVWKADALLKSPLFALLFWAPFKVFGIHLAKARFFLLFYTLVIWLVIIQSREIRPWAAVFFVYGCLQLYVFEYGHYIMPEILCCHVIVLALYYLYRYFTGYSFLPLLWSAVLFSSVWYLKVQFIYILPLPVVLFVLFSLKQRKRKRLTVWRDFGLLVGVLFLMFLLYYGLWYLPHKPFYDYLFIAENKSRIDNPAHMWETVKFYYKHVLSVPEMAFHTFTFQVSLLAGVILFLFARLSFSVKFFLVAALCWFGLELHKLVLLYIPLRYLISFMYAALLFGAVVIAAAVSASRKMDWSPYSRIVWLLLFLLLLPVLYNRAEGLYSVYSARTYNIAEANQYLRHTVRTGSVIPGNWAATLTWQISNETIPVTHWVINDEKIFTSVYPEVLIAEQGEADSDGAYRKKNIDLYVLSDSVRQFQIGRWKVNVWWLKPGQQVRYLRDREK